RPPVSLTWRVGGVVVPGDPATSAEPVDPLFIQAPHFREAEPVAVRLMRETKAKVMLFAVNRHSGSDYPRYMNAARPGSHIFITLMDDLNDRFPLAAGIVLHGMRRRGDQPNPTSGMIQPGDNKDMMRVRERFNVPSFNDMLARGFGLALESVPADFPGIEVDPRLQEEMRAPNGSSFGLGDMENFFWAVNTSKIHGYSAEHVKRIQAIHLEMPQTFRYEEISGVHNPYLEGNQRALVRAVNTAMEEYKQSSAFGTTAEPDYCQTTCRIHYYQGLGVRIFDRADFEGKEWILPIGGEDGQLYDARNIDDVDSILFPEGWSGEITFYENADGTGASVTFNSSDSNPTESAFASSAASVSVGQPLFFEPGLPVTVEAEDYNSKSGGLKVETKSGGITNLGRIGTGDWAKYENVDLTGKNTFTAQIASRNDTSSGTITVHIDDRDTVPVAVLKDAPGPGGWSSFGPASAPLNREVYGAHDVYLVFGSGYNLDAFTFAFQTVSSADHVEAEQYTEAQGRISIEVKSTGVTCLGRIGTGDWVRYAGIDFGDGADTLNARIATRSATSSGAISVHLGSLDNPPVATLTDVSGPGGWENFAPASVPLSEVVTGVHDVYLKFESGYNLDSFGFVSQ
ncbi:MAG: carbohydrate-binding protein, partial [Acidobacteriota bacterium]